MPRKRNTVRAHEAFTKLGIPPKDWTPAMQLAHKQKWTNLPVDLKVSELREQIAAIKPAHVPTVEEVKSQLVLAGNPIVTEADAVAEHARLKRNAAVNAWRQRNQLQAALDARELRFAAMRSAKKPAAPTATDAPAPMADAS